MLFNDTVHCWSVQCCMWSANRQTSQIRCVYGVKWNCNVLGQKHRWICNLGSLEEHELKTYSLFRHVHKTAKSDY
jgi:hypothetical protein